MEAGLRRYTTLSSALHILQNRCLTLLSPDKWDDRNDAYFLSQYRRRSGAGSVLALCFAEAPETYHHWRVFAHGPEGVCIQFRKETLEEYLADCNGLIFRNVQYKKLNTPGRKPFAVSELPFVKRWPYRDEKEYRIIHVCDDEIEAQPIEIGLETIERITLSPWIPKPLSETIKASMKSIRGCSKLHVYRSTLVDTESWKRRANPNLTKVF